MTGWAASWRSGRSVLLTVASPVGEALEGGAQPGLESSGIAEFGAQDPAAGGDAEHEGVDRRGSAAGVRVIQTTIAQVTMQRLQRVRVEEGGQRLRHHQTNTKHTKQHKQQNHPKNTKPALD